VGSGSLYRFGLAGYPWHVTAFHPDYKMTDPLPTSVQKLLEAAEIGQEAGLHYVYAGNIPGRVRAMKTLFAQNARHDWCSGAGT